MLYLPISGECEFSVNYQKYPVLDELYFNAEKEDGYFRDRCVFDDDIDIEDSMSVTVKYSKGTLLTYSLIAYSPYEGWKMAVNGTKGRLEADEYHSGQRIDEPYKEIKVYNTNGEVVTHSMKKAKGGHGGGDSALLRMLFVGDLPDPLGHCAGSNDGAKSIMVGICANKSIKDKRPYFIKDLLTSL